MKKYRVFSKLSTIILIIALINIVGLFVFYYQFPDVTIDQIFYHLRTSLSGVSWSFIVSIGVKFLGVLGALVVVLLLAKHFLKNKKKEINPQKTVIMFIASIVLLLGSYVYAFIVSDASSYLESYKTESKYIEKNYVKPDSSLVSLPKRKRNLIIIYLESIESSMSNIKNGGLFKNNYIPNLTKIAKDNLSFSANDKLGGAVQIYGTGWSTAGYLATTAGIIIKSPFPGDGPNNNPFTYPKLITVADILENYYNEELMLGSTSNFGGIKEYYSNHGKFTIWDQDNAVNEKLINKDNNDGWGLNDKGLYERSKTELINLSKQDKPFLFNLITIDTHAEDGYVDSSCPNKFKTSYENSVYCADILINDYLNWLKKQDFYKNTTIVILGDHLSMNKSMFNNVTGERYAYNAFINSVITKKTSHIYTPLDYYPTILESIGIKIKGDRLGLGTSLFSKEQTLIEKNNLDYINNELSKRSIFYENELLY